MIHTGKGFGIVNKADIDVFLELPCFFDDPEDVGNLAFGNVPLMLIYEKGILNVGSGECGVVK